MHLVFIHYIPAFYTCGDSVYRTMVFLKLPYECFNFDRTLTSAVQGERFTSLLIGPQSSVCPLQGEARDSVSFVCFLSDLTCLIVKIISCLSDAASQREVEPSCKEEPLGLLTTALRELRASVTDPTQRDGEDRAVGWAVRSGCPWVHRPVLTCSELEAALLPIVAVVSAFSLQFSIW